MEDNISPKYLMKLIADVEKAIWAAFTSYKNVKYYIEKWHKWEDYNNQNFSIELKQNEEIDLTSTLHNINGELLIKIAIDLGIETPDFIPSIATFRNEIKSDYKTANATFNKAFKQIETHPDIAVSLANSALESIIKHIFEDEMIKTKPKQGKTLYELTAELLKEFQLYPNSTIPIEIKTIGSSFLAVNQSIEKLRSEKTDVHGKFSEEYIIEDSLYTYFIVNSIATIGLFLMSYYKKKFPIETKEQESVNDDLPF
ncbi:MAG: abortive infection family protein [Bacteroidales bacterium]